MGSIVIHIIHYYELFIAYKDLSSLEEVHVNHNLKLFMVSGVVSSKIGVIHVMHNIELMMKNHSYHLIPELLISSRGLRSWDPESFISPIMLCYSTRPQP